MPPATTGANVSVRPYLSATAVNVNVSPVVATTHSTVLPSLGKTKEDMLNIVEWTIPLLPDEKPRHLLGIGQIRDIFEAVERGVDLFDCVIPTREARHKAIYTKKGRLQVRKMKLVDEPLERDCACLACSKGVTWQKLHTLFAAKDPQAFLYSTMHNIQFYNDLMKRIRESIQTETFEKLKKELLLFY